MGGQARARVEIDVMRLLEWGPLVEERLVRRAPSLGHALRGKDRSGRLRPGDAAIVFQRPVWRSERGFVSIWPSSWPPVESDEHARATFFRPLPFGGHGGNPETERRYRLDSEGAEEAALDIAVFLAPGPDDRWSHAASLREPRQDADSFLIDLVHELGHATAFHMKGSVVEGIVLEGVEVVADSVKALGGHVARHLSLGRGSADDAVGVVAGVVAERLSADRNAVFLDAIGTFVKQRDFYSDLEEAIGLILADRRASAMDLRKLNEALSVVLEEARAILHPRIERIQHEAARWRRRVIEERSSTLAIRWDADLGRALGCPTRREFY